MNALSGRFLLIATTLIGVILLNGVVARASSASVSVGQLVTLTATADGTAPFTYQWFKDGNALAGAVSAAYTVSSFQAADVGTYTALISNSAGSTTTDDAVLTLAAANVLPVFSTQPTSQIVNVGDTVSFAAAASGTPVPTFQWLKNGGAVSGATGTSYALSSVVLGDAGSYTLIATNSVGAVSSTTVSLAVNAATTAPVITTQPTSQTVIAGGAVTLTTVASGVPAPTFQWQKNSVAISGATNFSYTIAGTVMGDAGSYTVVATNSVSAVTSNSATLTINAAPVAPAINAQPASQVGTVGGSVTFTVAASGSPSPTYQWRKNGANISGATSASYTMSNLTVANGATYTVVVSNSAGSITSNGGLLTINTSPAFTIQPVGQTVTAGSAVTFIAAASGPPAPTYQWQKDGATLSGATTATYVIATAATSNAGSYTVVVTNSAGAATSNAATLTVNAAPATPVFTTQPGSQSVIAGSSVTFIAAASGTPTPTFQWKKGGATISGATKS